MMIRTLAAQGDRAADRAFDIAVSVVILALTAPLIAASVVLVALTSRGPAIYTQVRLGRDGRPFTIYKVRTMAHDCERATGPQWSAPGDPRVTSVGRLLRVTHLDELPQLWNVLKGEMSLVGPRPERPEIAARLEAAIPRYAERTRSRPGLTGLAQVQLPPDTDQEGVRRKLACDLYYLRHRTLWLDLRILAGTATGVLGIPFSVPQRLLGLPRWEAIERPDEAPARAAVAASQARSQLA